MKYFIEGRERKIYFTKDNTAFYKSKGNQDVTYMFKKTKNGLELRKKYLKRIIRGGMGDGDDQEDTPPLPWYERYLFGSSVKKEKDKEILKEEDSKYSTILGHFDKLHETIQEVKIKPNFDSKDKYNLLEILWKIRITLHYNNHNTIMQKKSSSSIDSNSVLELKEFDIILREPLKPSNRKKLVFDSNTLEYLALKHIPNMSPSYLMNDKGEIIHDIPDNIELKNLLKTDYKRQDPNKIREENDEETAEEKEEREKKAKDLEEQLKKEEAADKLIEKKEIQKILQTTKDKAKEDSDYDLEPIPDSVIQKREKKQQIKTRLFELLTIVELLVKKYIEDENNKSVSLRYLKGIKSKLQPSKIRISNQNIYDIIKTVATIVEDIKQKEDLISNMQALVDRLNLTSTKTKQNEILDLDLYYVNNMLNEILQLEELKEEQEQEQEQEPLSGGYKKPNKNTSKNTSKNTPKNTPKNTNKKTKKKQK